MRRITILFQLMGIATLAAELPVRSVVLYKHGVGYFERSGELGPGETARLDFKASEMNDVLKSLTIVDRSGSRIVGLRYDSSEPLNAKLSEYPIRLGEGQPISALLDQLKGARLELTFGAETFAGSIVGARTVAAARDQSERQEVILLLDSGQMRSFDLAAASGLRFADPILQRQLKEYLSVLTQARSREKRSVYIDSSDAGRRQIAAAYMIPTPVWKSSYRLLFPGSGEPILEGWAVVDNTTGDDWTKVNLALVSGRPISFISPLYEPRYAEREVAVLPEDQVSAPIVHEGAIEKESAPLAAAPPPSPAAPERAMKGRREMVAEAAGRATADTPSTITAAAEGRELGELFEYRFAGPVTVRKNESAMLPFLQQQVSSRKLLVYSDEGSVHPRNAAEITNSTGKTLDGGPVTVFDNGAYAGEALMETLKAGDKRLISYAIDLGTRVTTHFDSSEDDIQEVHLRRGVLVTRSALRETRTYTIRNVDQKPKTLVIEHPAREGYQLLDRKPAETTADAYRFEVKLAAGATEKVPVTEERVYENTYALANQTPDFLLTIVQNKALSDSARRQIEQILDQKRQIAETDRDIRRIEQEIAEVVRDQERIRQNIKSLNEVSGQQDQVQKYARELADREVRLAALRDQAEELRKKKAALETELNRLIETVTF